MPLSNFAGKTSDPPTGCGSPSFWIRPICCVSLLKNALDFCSGNAAAIRLLNLLWMAA